MRVCPSFLFSYIYIPLTMPSETSQKPAKAIKKFKKTDTTYSSKENP